MKSEEQKEMIRFLIVLAVIIVFVALIYFLTRVFITKEDKDTDTGSDEVAGSVNYDMAIVGNMLNKPEDEYYVFIYDYESYSEDMYKVMDVISNYLYSDEEDLLRVYNVELDNYLNASYKVKEGEKSNPKATKVEDFKFGDFTVIKVENGKVKKYMETAAAIEKEFKIED